ncbi:MAG: glutathione transport system permease protein [Pseudonocardiales bacterium]|jgi:peptide/nickel transport system permease protein|nr:glutathione transport system permease protein [Pseudonocardiales bacterium]
MLIFTIRRLINSLFVLLAASFFVYLFAASQYDPLSRLRQQPNLPPGTIERQKHLLGLDRPLLSRYWDWLRHLVHFDFHSIAFIRFQFGKDVNGSTVSTDLATRLEITMRMITGAIILAILIAIIAGVISGVRRDKPIDFVVTIVTFMLIALPTFFFAALLKQGAIYSNQHIGTDFKTAGDEDFGLSAYGTHSQILHSQLLHLILPTISLALITTAGWIRYQRASMIDVLDADYLRLARAKGVRWKTVIRRHGLRNALIPLTTVVAIDVGALFGGAIITEHVYVWHGMGEYLNIALQAQDINAVVGWVMVSAIFVVLFNFFADLLYAALDPRIRL